MSENERVRVVRKDAHLTMAEFAKRIGVTTAAISNIENGNRSVTNQMRASICREFHIREEWLRDGEGEKEAAEPTFSLDEYVRQQGATELELELIKLYLNLPADTRKTVVEHFRAGLARFAVPETAEGHFPETEEELQAELHRQYAEEKNEGEDHRDTDSATA